jgi:hypothetical protein
MTSRKRHKGLRRSEAVVIKLVRSLFAKTIWGRVSAIEEKIIVKEKYSPDTFYYRLLNLSKSPDDTIGNRVQNLENTISNDLHASRVCVNVKYSCVDEDDGSSYKSSHTMKLSDVIDLMLDHCGLEILPPGDKPAGVVREKK